jgi:hypothetical protein
MPQQTTTRDILIKSWHAVRCRATDDGVVMNAAAFAGYALDAGLTLSRARMLVPTDPLPYWGRVHSHLDKVEAEERPSASWEVSP